MKDLGEAKKILGMEILGIEAMGFCILVKTDTLKRSKEVLYK